jgi:hypothetical protein
MFKKIILALSLLVVVVGASLSSFSAKAETSGEEVTATQSAKSASEKRELLIVEFLKSESYNERARINQEIQKLNQEIGDKTPQVQGNKAVYAPEVLGNTETALVFVDFLTAGTGISIKNINGGDFSSFECKDTIEFGLLKIPSICNITELANFNTIVILLAFVGLIIGAFKLALLSSEDTRYKLQMRRMIMSGGILVLILSGAFSVLFITASNVTNQLAGVTTYSFSNQKINSCATIAVDTQNSEEAISSSSMCAYWRDQASPCLSEYSITCAIQEAAFEELAHQIKYSSIEEFEPTIFKFEIPTQGEQSIDCTVCDFFLQNAIFWSAYFASLPLLFYIFIIIATLPLVLSVQLMYEYLSNYFRIILMYFRSAVDLDGSERIGEDIKAIFSYFVRIISVSLIVSLYIFFLRYIFITQQNFFSVIYIFVISTILLSLQNTLMGRFDAMLAAVPSKFVPTEGKQAYSKTREIKNKFNKDKRTEQKKEDKKMKEESSRIRKIKKEEKAEEARINKERLKAEKASKTNRKSPGSNSRRSKPQTTSNPANKKFVKRNSAIKENKQARINKSKPKQF